MKNDWMQWGVYAALGIIGTAAFLAVAGGTTFAIKIPALAVCYAIIKAAKWAKRHGWLPSQIANIEE